MMSYHNDRIRVLTKRVDLGNTGSTGISLHCHSLYSKEILDFVPYYAERIPLVSYMFRRECERYFAAEGRYPNFTIGHWEPPLTGRQVFDAECDQMRGLGLDGIVSITDHDSIQANLDLQDDVSNDAAPISLEWTVPFGEAYFHLGIHNLPTTRADEIRSELLAYTTAEGEPDNDRLRELFAMLNDMPDVLIVFNHPAWDIEMIGETRHKKLMNEFVAANAEWIHAIEVNGFRPWDENRMAIELADRLGLPIISGGDRHCLHSNTIINVTNAVTFAEFVDEIRIDRFSRLVITPEYRLPLIARQASSMGQILGHYPDFPEDRRRWSDRVFFDAEDGRGPVSLSSHWNGCEPVMYRAALRLLGAIGHHGIQGMLKLVLSPNEPVIDTVRPERSATVLGGRRVAVDG